MLGGAVAAQLQVATVRLRPCAPVRQAVVGCIIKDERLRSRQAASVVLSIRTRTSAAGGGSSVGVTSARKLKPVVERFKIQHEKNVSEERLKELGVNRWSKWECGSCVTTFWRWQVDELVYITKGSVEIVPDGCVDSAYFYAGDLVRFPKWFSASLTFEEDYEQCYKFMAYGD